MQDLFSSVLKRNELLKIGKNLNNKYVREIKVNVYRNYSVEPIFSVIKPFLDYVGLGASFEVSSYDDSLSFDDIKESDLEIIFIDIVNYKESPIFYIIERLKHLRSLVKSPILVFFLGAISKVDIDVKFADIAVQHKISNCFVYNIENLLHSYDIFDLSKFDIMATRLSNSACLKLAQILGLSIIPSLFFPSLKALAIDLDNTLYDGVLGEDGISDVKLTEGHKKLQERILEFKKQGYFLALVSKNEEGDARSLFETRKDFPLQWEDFDCVKINWKEKSLNLEEVAKHFNIGLDSILFIDDNIAEIENVKQIGVKSILAVSPNEVLRMLEIFPNARKLYTNQEDNLRSRDVAANSERKKLEAISQEDYFRNLKIVLTFSVNNISHVSRITELLNKTNQFITNYSRPTQKQVEDWLASENYIVVDIAMSDRLSDSGIIAIIVGTRKNNGEVHILDLCISCRALGRKLEEIMLFKAFHIICERLNAPNNKVVVPFVKGDRNQPCLDLLLGLKEIQMVEDGQIILGLKKINVKNLVIKEE